MIHGLHSANEKTPDTRMEDQPKDTHWLGSKAKAGARAADSPPEQRPRLWKRPSPHSSELGGLSASRWQRRCFHPFLLLSLEALGVELRMLQRASEQLPRGIRRGITGGSCRPSRCHGGGASRCLQTAGRRERRRKAGACERVLCIPALSALSR